MPDYTGGIYLAMWPIKRIYRASSKGHREFLSRL